MKFARYFTFLLIAFLLGLKLVSAQTLTEFTLSVDEDSLTIVLEVGNAPTVSLQGFAFETVVSQDGERKTFPLADFPMFEPMNFASLQAPLCFRLEVDNANTPMPLACSLQSTLIQPIARTDRFWYDTASRSTRVLFIVGGSTTIFCPSGADECNLTYSALFETPTPRATTTLNLVPTPAITATISPAPQITRIQLDELFGAGNWYCMPDRYDKLGIRFLTANFVVVAPIRSIDNWDGNHSLGEAVNINGGATVNLDVIVLRTECPLEQQNALTIWEEAQRTNSVQLERNYFDDVFGSENWYCVETESSAIKVRILPQNFQVQYPFTNVDTSDNRKHGVGDIVVGNLVDATAWTGNISRNECR